jgi:hypothetical protein
MPSAAPGARITQITGELTRTTSGGFITDFHDRGREIALDVIRSKMAAAS